MLPCLWHLFCFNWKEQRTWLFHWWPDFDLRWDRVSVCLFELVSHLHSTTLTFLIISFYEKGLTILSEGAFSSLSSLLELFAFSLFHFPFCVCHFLEIWVRTPFPRFGQGHSRVSTLFQNFNSVPFPFHSFPSSSIDLSFNDIESLSPDSFTNFNHLNYLSFSFILLFVL